jgi:inner membrane protein
MEKMTHIIMAFLVLLIFGFVLNFPLYMAVYAFIGVLIPDIDTKTKKYHRKLLHNLWILIIILFVGLSAGLFDRGAAIIFSIGFVSHLIGDSITHQGIMPLWPIKKPKFNGPISTGSIGEYLVVVILLIMIYWIGTVI